MRGIRGLESAKIVLCIETNHSEGFRLPFDLAMFRPQGVFVLRERKDSEYGVLATNSLKREMATSLSLLLLQKLIRFHPRLSCVSRDENEQHTPETIRKLLIDQIGRYERQIFPRKNDPGMFTEKYSGKRHGPDDLCISLQYAYKTVEYWRAKIDYYSSMPPLFE